MPSSYPVLQLSFKLIANQHFRMDVSFPVSTLFLSNAVPREHQGISASLVNTVVNYSIAIGLGIAGTVEAEIPNSNSLLDGYRAAQYTSVGLSGLGLGVSILLVALRRRKEPQKCDA
jgi:hypothetical protein